MLTLRMQVQAIADRIAGRPVRPGLRAAHFAEPWRLCWNALEEYADPERAATEMLERLAEAGEDVGAVSQALMKAARGGPPPAFRPLSAIAAGLPPVRWLWQPWIPLDMITLIGAAPGVGKTSVLLDICRRILAGDAFPDGAAMPEWALGRNVIFVDGEGVPQVINARTQSWSMDASRFYLMEPDDGDEIDFDRVKSRDLLIEMVAELNPALVAIDSLGAVTSRGENSIDDVRGVMKFFKSVAGDWNWYR